ncbi:MAG: hypothetical protein R3275_08225 [Saprospiraceae bacterium]|nr:hypothetical protein [Saprospiraceae bacterium]
MKTIFTVILGLFACVTIGQTNLAIGEWEVHIPYKFGLSVTQSPNYVYYSTDLGLMRLSKEDRQTTEFITTIDGLSQAERSVIKYHPSSRTLVVAYETGIIDLLTSSGVTTMTDISNFDNFPIDKTPNHIYDDFDAVILSGNFGMSRIDVENQKVLWTTFTLGNAVHALSRVYNIYFAATDDGLYSIPIEGQTENFQAWEKLGATHGLPEGVSFGAATRWENRLYVGAGESLYMLNDSIYLEDSVFQFEEIFKLEDFDLVHLSSESWNLLATYYCPDQCNAQVIGFSGDSDTTSSQPECTSRTLETIQDGDGWVYYADQFNGYRLSHGNGNACVIHNPNSPFSSNINEIAVGRDEVVIASGGTVNGFFYSFRNDGFFILNEDGRWSARNLFNVDTLKERDLKNFHRVKIHPITGDQYHGTYWNGIVVYHQDGTYTFYTEENSALRKKDDMDPRERVIGMEFDQEANLWVATFLAPEHDLAVLRNDGTWKGFDPPNFGSGPNEVAVDSNGYKWITMTGDASRGVYVFDEGDMDDDLDDRYQLITQNNSELPSNMAICVTVDLDGDVWVGTNEGAVVFACGENLFEGECRGNRPKVLQDTILALLLETEEVRSIAVDGANRKWFGTNNGVFVQSPSGEEQVLAFNTDNSPLLSNVINDIAIDRREGIVYIGTDKGLCVYRTEATLGGAVHAREVYAYPNPVRPGYEGPIAIKGLPRDADVKITDVSGTLIYETTALGGQAIWDGRDYNGVKAKSGVYLVFTTSDSGSFDTPEGLVTKVLIMN